MVTGEILLPERHDENVLKHIALREQQVPYSYEIWHLKKFRCNWKHSFVNASIDSIGFVKN